ncbi:ribonuclease VapC [Sphingomonas sp. YR710]|jgi:ribonuclease VapC|uniref:type II toxin-antitoxin system VapC family toxin n=1 Tax=Sphingomonas sp. YR710 TaxID=1882773 RepID=UPI000883666C|nr:type II toxin-antitoxin system VapC family toxin [Sphingomonas sp. YR710]SDC84771.1 ribonuclease VapC [Sphingomonas sp. YR710]
MIVVDSSALIAIFEREPDATIYATAILQADRLMISAVNVHETGMVMRARRGEAAERQMWGFLLEDNDFEIVPFDEAQAREALLAFGRYGKGIAPKARLNLSDCAAYALAKTMEWPLLFKGDDFAATDIKACV